ncbi:MAG: class I SAM-dependent methyltransferase [Candidatus Azambacteria bacterium]|nr:class I SAM-dependent methyltransferase [Candidatus Azambacteria bacterium]
MEEIRGFNGTKEEALKIWQKNAERWFSVGSPWRPSAGDVAIYKKLAGNKISGNVLILGSTPELRDLVAEKGNNPTLIDMSETMLKKMLLLAKVARAEKEQWITSGWEEVSLPKDHFDLILGDMVWWVISVPDQIILTDKIARVLKPDGLFISRFRVRDAKRADENFFAVIKNYLARLDNEPRQKQLIRDEMVSYLHDITADIGKCCINRRKTKTFLLEITAKTNNLQHKKFFEEASLNLLSADWTSQTREEIMAILQGNFILKKDLSAKDYDAEFYPIMKLAKK